MTFWQGIVVSLMVHYKVIPSSQVRVSIYITITMIIVLVLD
jgi:hypothetical protein